jgi:hypothetical protein
MRCRMQGMPAALGSTPTMSPNMLRLSILSRTRNTSEHVVGVKRLDDPATRALAGYEADLAQGAQLIGDD